ncbi:MAG: tRNA (adenosine(37)-N6)-threonylcarbamoyltransferase complex dimerization subunit type 1 TsaB [Flavobacteriales bacterium]|nr:tRNA (adenosine(37)-N6)-threonylcarbamoyltransferase complex dimerization subunit type 1 TsaB [Flavobacteriales bacterium]
MPLLLSFDTATKHCAVALSEGCRVLASRVEEGEKFSHAEKLNVFIAEVMTEAGRDMDELDAVAVGVGPGSYTGLRIGLSAAKGLCFALDIPLIGMGTLDVLVAQYLSLPNIDRQPGDVLFPMIDARRMEVFTTAFDGSGKEVGESQPMILDDPWCSALPQDKRHLVFGDGADKASALWTGHSQVTHVVGIRPSVFGLVACAETLFSRGDFADMVRSVPAYGKVARVGGGFPL